MNICNTIILALLAIVWVLVAYVYTAKPELSLADNKCVELYINH